MATRLIEKGEIKDGMQALIMHVEDADGTWRAEVLARYPVSEIADQIGALLRNGQIQGKRPADIPTRSDRPRT